MITTLENNYIRIKIRKKGGELVSLVRKKDNHELLWQADSSIWNGHAPLLFPIIGELKDGYYTYNDEKYTMPRHGIVRKSEAWEITKKEDCIEAAFISSKETKEFYPFDFRLSVNYILDKNSLRVVYKIMNDSIDEMPFCIGGHPGFNCDHKGNTDINQYYLKFSEEETANIHLLTANGLLKKKEENFLFQTERLNLSSTIFNRDALVFKSLKSKQISLYSPEEKILDFHFKDFPYLGIWAKPNAPYVCIEPWIGHADMEDSNHKIVDKEGVQILAPQQKFECSYSICIA